MIKIEKQKTGVQVLYKTQQLGNKDLDNFTTQSGTDTTSTRPGHGLPTISSGPSFGRFRSRFWNFSSFLHVYMYYMWQFKNHLLRPITVQTTTKRRHGLFGQWNVHVIVVRPLRTYTTYVHCTSVSYTCCMSLFNTFPTASQLYLYFTFISRCSSTLFSVSSKTNVTCTKNINPFAQNDCLTSAPVSQNFQNYVH